MRPLFLTILGAFALFGTMSLISQDKAAKERAAVSEPAEGQAVVTLGAGCFWCVEAVLQRVEGVVAVTSGYMGGTTENPTYEEICTGKTGHAEVVRVVYDPAKLPLPELLGWFWKLHDPTQLNRQGNDIGTQYRSAIFFHRAEDEGVARESVKAAQKDFAKPIVTEITAASVFYPGEVYHQDYYSRNKSRNPYCPAVITPKLRKLGFEE